MTSKCTTMQLPQNSTNQSLVSTWNHWHRSLPNCPAQHTISQVNTILSNPTLQPLKPSLSTLSLTLNQMLPQLLLITKCNDRLYTLLHWALGTRGTSHLTLSTNTTTQPYMPTTVGYTTSQGKTATVSKPNYFSRRNIKALPDTISMLCTCSNRVCWCKSVW